VRLSPFHAYYQASTLANYAYDRDRLTVALASSEVEIFPFQVAAALFAMRSPFIMGAVLCDDGSLGKTYEALLVLSQRWHEGCRRIIIIVPAPLLGQWRRLIDRRFSLPLFVVDGSERPPENQDQEMDNPFRQVGAILTTYDYAAEQADLISEVEWELAVFEEAHHLRQAHSGESRKLPAVKAAVGRAFKLLLTATPIQNSILDIYGLINFIDEGVFYSEDAFYRRYFRRTENYGELAERLRPYCFRTRRDEVAGYLKITQRLAVTCEYALTGEERQLHGLLADYLDRPVKVAFPKMDVYDLALMLWRSFSSSPAAFGQTLRGVISRLEKNSDDQAVADELNLFREMLSLCEGIDGGTKAETFLKVLRQSLTRLKKAGAAPKALIFTDNIATQKYLFQLLNHGRFRGRVLTFNGKSSRDYSLMDRFQNEADILIATDLAAEGFNLEFCSLVINYDLPYNALKVEQRVGRCHRQGQANDVLVVNFLCRENFYDVRLLELINKRLLQFDGVFGLAEDWLGQFGSVQEYDLTAAQARSKAEIEAAFERLLEEHKDSNKALVRSAEDILFSGFTDEIHSQAVVSPRYLKDKVKALNDSLWAVTRWFFDGKEGYELDDETRTLRIGLRPEKVFTGTIPRRREYSMTDRSLPKTGWYTIISPLAQNILGEIFWRGIPDRGEIKVEAEMEPCRIGFYEITIKADFFNQWRYCVLVGRTASGRVMDEAECRRIMELPVQSYQADREIYGRRDGRSKPKAPDPLDKLVDPEPFRRETVKSVDLAESQEIARLKAYNLEAKLDLERRLDRLRRQISQAESRLGQASAPLEKLEAMKFLNSHRQNFKAAEQTLFLDKMRLDAELEQRLEEVAKGTELSSEVVRLFAIDVTGA